MSYNQQELLVQEFFKFSSLAEQVFHLGTENREEQLKKMYICKTIFRYTAQFKIKEDEEFLKQYFQYFLLND